ncbi:MAG TPA: hypothetical protein VGJ26_12325 [Pirellulales bacterium]|jgi:hypothetical protein
MSEARRNSWFQFGITEILILTTLLAVVWGASASFPVDLTLTQPAALDAKDASADRGNAGAATVSPSPGAVLTRGIVLSAITIFVWAIIRRAASADEP